MIRHINIAGALKKTLLAAGTGLCLLLAAGAMPPALHKAQAAHVEDGALDDSTHMNQLIYERIRYRWVASWMLMTQQFTATMMHQMLIIGMFFDAKHQLETQRLFQTLVNRAHKDYHPGDQMCRFGTTVRSLAATDERSRINAQIVSTILLNRESLAANTAARDGKGGDKKARIAQFKRTYCDINDNNGRLRAYCRLSENHDGEEYQRGAPDARTNKDINFVQTVGNRYTLDIDFINTDLTEDETDILALARNLYAHDVFTRISSTHLEMDVNHDNYQDVRSIIALRGLARNSFGHIVGQRVRGTDITAPFIRAVVEELGVPADELDQFMGEHPSYFAQMEVITRKMYQNPSFYANLYDKPANVSRAGAALQAIRLMHDRDRFEGALRREMLLSGILELRLREAQDDIVNQLTNTQEFEAGSGAGAGGAGAGAGAGAGPGGGP